MKNGLINTNSILLLERIQRGRERELRESLLGMSKKGRASENSAIAIPATLKIVFYFFFFFTVTGDDRGTSNGARPTMSYLAKIIFKAWVVSAVDHPWTTLNSVLGASSELQISLLFFFFFLYLSFIYIIYLRLLE